ncbi:MAG: hypothetical protein ACRDO7_16605 [Nocardioidaceae bacterium]
MSRRTTGIITAVVLILLGGAAGYGINNLLSTRAPEEGLSEAQVGSVATQLITARNDLLVTPEDAEEDAEEDTGDGEKTPPASAELLEGRSSGGVAMSQGAILAERQTYRLLREHRRDLEGRGTVYTEAELDVEVDSLTINEATAIAIVDETTTFTGERGGKSVEIEQSIERVMSLSRVGGNWIMRSIRTMSGKDAPENGL